MAQFDCFLCQKPNCTTKCSKPNCDIYYCCDSHYSSHIVNLNQKLGYNDNSGNGEIKSEGTEGFPSLCLPYKIVNSDKFGRHFVATRDIKPLELILVDPPGAVGPATKTKPICVVCLSPSKGKYR